MASASFAGRGSRSASQANVQSGRLARILIVDRDPASRELARTGPRERGARGTLHRRSRGGLGGLLRVLPARRRPGPAAASWRGRGSRRTHAGRRPRPPHPGRHRTVAGDGAPPPHPAGRPGAALAPVGDPGVQPGTARVLGRPAIETGELGFAALADLLVRLWRSAADGVVAIEHPGGADLVFLLRGATVGVQLAGERHTADVSGRAGLALRPQRSLLLLPPGRRLRTRGPGRAGTGARPAPRGPPDGGGRALLRRGTRGGPEEVPVRSGAFAVLARDIAFGKDDLRTVAGLDGHRPIRTLLSGPGRPASLLWFLVRARRARPAPDRDGPTDPGSLSASRDAHGRGAGTALASVARTRSASAPVNSG